MSKKINVKGTKISVIVINDNDYISLTDMIKAKDGDFFISDWLRNRNTVEFLGIWERIHNFCFNYGEYAIITSKAGLNSYKISVKEWVKRTNAIGLRASAGRYGGTYAHKDIAFEFGLWISAEFKVYLIKEFQRLKTEENEKKRLGWDLKRNLANVSQLVCLANLEALNSLFIKEGLSQRNRLRKLNEIAISQMKLLLQDRTVKKLGDTKGKIR